MFPLDPHHSLPRAERYCDLAVVFLVDARGWVLLQERDEHAPTSPNQWGIVGGHVEPGEDRAAAARRELLEETGLELADGVLSLWFDDHRSVDPQADPGRADHWQVWVGRVDLTDDDIVVGEGRQIVFVDPSRIGELDLAAAAAYFLPRFLASPAYRALAGAPAPSAGRSPAAPPGPGS